METGVSYVTERMDHLGIVAGVCREIGLAEWLDSQAGGTGRKVSVGTATVAMVLNGLGFSNRRLYLVPQFFANKPVGRLLGAGLKAEDLNDDCLGRTLDWIYESDPTRLFAGIARRAREAFGIGRKQLHVDTTSFSVSGEYKGLDEAVIEVTYGYSRDHRDELKQWMLSLAATHDGDVPVYMRPLDGNSSDNATLVESVKALQEQFRAEEADEPCIFVADSKLYSEANMRMLGEAKVWWVCRVPETSTEAKRVIEPHSPDWQSSADGQTRWYTRVMELSQGKERWVVVSSEAGEERAKETTERKVVRGNKGGGGRSYGTWATGSSLAKPMLKPHLRERPRSCRGGSRSVPR
jgi:transposase